MRTFIIRLVTPIILLSACNFPRLRQPFPPAESPQDYLSTECAFVWANEPLPELSDDFNESMKAIHPNVEGYAQAYGENCVTNEGEVVRFLAMETDYHITFKVDNLGDKKMLGNYIEEIMSVLTEFPPDETPGPQPGYIGITFEAQKEELRLWFTQTEAQTAIDDGLQGKALFDALSER